MKTIFGIWAAYAVVCLALGAAALYVVCHFLAKFW